MSLQEPGANREQLGRSGETDGCAVFHQFGGRGGGLGGGGGGEDRHWIEREEASWRITQA